MMFQLICTARSTSMPVNKIFVPYMQAFWSLIQISGLLPGTHMQTFFFKKTWDVLRWTRGKKASIPLNDQTTKQRGNATLIDRIQKNQGTFWNYWGAGRNWGSQGTYATNWQRQKETYVTHEERHSLETQIPNARSNKQEGITLQAQTIIREITKLSWSSNN